MSNADELVALIHGLPTDQRAALAAAALAHRTESELGYAEHELKRLKASFGKLYGAITGRELVPAMDVDYHMREIAMVFAAMQTRLNALEAGLAENELNKAKGM